MKLRRQLVLFSVGGAFGFIVDAGVLQLLVAGIAWDRFTGRLISFLCAATVTWVFNRRYTFRGSRRHSLWVEWLRYVFAMSGGFACNFAAYSALVLWLDIQGRWLILAVAAGSVAGLGVNFAASRYWVYRHHRHELPPQAMRRPEEHAGPDEGAPAATRTQQKRTLG
jgi:putative flippase GtrA